MNVLRLAAFSDGNRGGNPAGVVITDTLPTQDQMQALACEVGASETVFAAPAGDRWRARYFSPEVEVPFCGHATVALGAALAMRCGDGRFELQLNEGVIVVGTGREGPHRMVALQSPPTRSAIATPDEVHAALALFGLEPDDLDVRLPPARIHGGADHLALALRSREKLRAMHYDFDRGRALFRQQGWVTVMLAHAESPIRFHVRNAFAYGGVVEDPATGAAGAAWGGYLRDSSWPHNGSVQLWQGDDMGIPCRLHLQIPEQPGTSVGVSGTVRIL